MELDQTAFDLPVIAVRSRTLPEGWEEAVRRLWVEGIMIPTQYDQEGDPLSRDAAVVIAVADPFAEPRIHRGMPGGYHDLLKYVFEVVAGSHNHWVDPAAGKWSYTYNGRIFAYQYPGQGNVVNQMEDVLSILTEAPYSRRAQVITWMPGHEEFGADPPCLQRMWFRVFGDRLVMNVDMRSNDAYKAAFMNMYAFTELQRWVAAQLSERLGRAITPGQYVHRADSFHVYGSDHDDFQGFLELLEKRPPDRRVVRSDDETVLACFAEARQATLQELHEAGLNIVLPE